MRSEAIRAPIKREALVHSIWKLSSAKLATLALLFSCVFGVSPASAEGQLKADEGFAYYCVGQRYKPATILSKGNPNTIIILKLHTSDIFSVPEDKEVECVSDEIDDDFVIKRFFMKNDKKMDGWVSFKFPIEIDGEVIKPRASITSANYESAGKFYRFNLSKNVCGFDQGPNEDGLLVANNDASRSCGSFVPIRAFGFLSALDDLVEIDCFSEEGGTCGFGVYFGNWRFSVQDIPRKFVPKWKEVHEKLVEALKKKIVLYLSSDACYGKLSCESLAPLANIEKQ